MIPIVECVQRQQLTQVGPTEFTVTIFDPDGITCYPPDGTHRPAIVGDVYSVQPNGEIQARVSGTEGAYERVVLADGGVVFAPLGVSGRAFKFPYASGIPNNA